MLHPQLAKTSILKLYALLQANIHNETLNKPIFMLLCNVVVKIVPSKQKLKWLHNLS